MTSRTASTKAGSARPAPRRRGSVLRRRAAALLGGAAVLTAIASAPAYAGIPDANVVDMFRTPVWTSITMNPNGPGYWTQVDADMGGGTTQAVGGAPDLGSISSQGGYLRSTPDGKGLYLIDENGDMSSRGDAVPVPSNIAKVSGWNSDDGDGTMRNPITGMAITASGRGGWVLDAEGDVWTFGDAHAMGAPEDNEVGSADDIVATSTGKGYTILTNAGDVYDYGDAVFYGHPHFSTNGNAFSKQATGIALTADDKGYWILDSDGGVTPYGDATNLGDNPHPGSTLESYSTDIAAIPDGSGYAIIQGNGTVHTYTSAEQ